MLVVVSPVRGAELSLEDVIDYGLIHNQSLVQLRNQISDLEMELKRIESGLDWQVHLSSSGGARNFDQANLPVKEDGEEITTEASFGFKGEKSFLWGLSIRPEIYLKGSELDELKTPQFKISLNQSLFPLTKTKTEQDYYKTERELDKLKMKLSETRADKIIDWVSNYLSLVRSRARYKLALEELELARASYETTLSEKEMGEAGEQQLLTARLEKKSAEYDLQQAQYQLDEKQKVFLKEIGLSQGTELKFFYKNRYLEKLRELVSLANIDLKAQEELMALLIVDNYQLYANKVDKEITQKELDWAKKEAGVQVDLNGSYNSDEEWQAKVNLAYNLFDGGQTQLKYEKLKDDIQDLDQTYEDILIDLKLELEKIIHKIELDQMNLKRKKLALKKAVLEAETYQLQLEKGLIEEWSLELESTLIKGNREQLIIALENLFDNQLRYADSIVKVGIEKDEVADQVILRIWNDGPQIEPEVMKNLFNKFKKGEEGDFGLGLAIVKGIIDQHQARIRTSNEDDGVAFYLYFDSYQG